MANRVLNHLTLSYSIGGNLTVIDETYAWDLYNYPKILNYHTGEIIDKLEEVPTGQQTSSIIVNLDLPKITINKKTKQVAIANGKTIEVLSM